MIPRSFQYVAPKTLPEVVRTLRKYKGDAKLLAGGHSLVPLMKLRLSNPQVIVDMRHLRPKLAYIKSDGKEVRIGALTRHAEIEHSAELKRVLPIFPAAAEWIGDMQVRNMGTIGGSLAHADPASDWPVVALATDATLVAYSGRTRRIPAVKFFQGPFTTSLKYYEVLTEIAVPKPPPEHGWAWKKFERKAGDFATVNTAVFITPGRDGRIERASIAVGAVHTKPYRATESERMLAGKVPTIDLLRSAAEKAAEIAEPASDLRGSAEYKREMVKVFVRRALVEACERANLIRPQVAEVR
ncbi:MAG: xanthine dehydrogenase family protein subunit M [Thaumarchaeota archaeon]|nr:xanthine dehydrogenase family protein subunit M [Candidatus Calditenuaceae archaeon]MDW8187663.1 xanthine dehydrogenase family protein subunit M [Nitrososphaerota archaeon]